MSQPSWLPPLVTLEMYGGDWSRYFEEIYNCFRLDFVYYKPSFRGTRLALKRHPVIEGKEATFWHLISEGQSEADRRPDLRRCERICWPRPIIENCDGSLVKVWENLRGSEKRILLWLEEQEYLAVLAERSGYILLWTAYTVTQTHQKKKLQKQYEAFIRSL